MSRTSSSTAPPGAETEQSTLQRQVSALTRTLSNQRKSGAFTGGKKKEDGARILFAALHSIITTACAESLPRPRPCPPSRSIKHIVPYPTTRIKVLSSTAPLPIASGRGSEVKGHEPSPQGPSLFWSQRVSVCRSNVTARPISAALCQTLQPSSPAPLAFADGASLSFVLTEEEEERADQVAGGRRIRTLRSPPFLAPHSLRLSPRHVKVASSSS